MSKKSKCQAFQVDVGHFQHSDAVASRRFSTYSVADTYGRSQRMLGQDVFQPMGFDACRIQGEI